MKPTPSFLSFVTAWLVGVSMSAALLRAQPSQIRFEDVTAASGVDFVHFDGDTGKKYLVEFMGSGVASLDYDNDGWLDLFFANGSYLPPENAAGSEATAPQNALYQNRRQLQFDTASDALPVASRYTLGVSAADFNEDGFVDLYLSNFGRNTLLQNNGDGTFTDVTDYANVGDGHKFGAGVVFIDANGDDYLDIFVGNYVDFDFKRHAELLPKAIPFPPGPKDFAAAPDTLFINQGDGRFEDESLSRGMHAVAGPSMGAVASDYDRDGDVDVFVACDGAPNLLYNNDGKGNFTNTALLSGVALDVMGVANGSMGADAADLDQDSFPEIFVTDYTEQFPMLFHNLGGGFEDMTRRSRIGTEVRPHVNWSTGLVDFDLDGDRDAFICNGHFLKNAAELTSLTQFGVANTVMENLGKMRFRSITSEVGSALEQALSSRGAVFDDLDNDGDIDVAILNCAGPAQVLANTGTESNLSSSSGAAKMRHWIALELLGTESTRSAVGAQVRVAAGAAVQFGEVRSGRGYQSHFGSRLHFGLGSESSIAEIRVLWPNGKEQTWQNVSADQIVLLKQQ